MDLYDILEEISIGFNSNTNESKKLRNYVDEIRRFLNEDIEEVELQFKEMKEDKLETEEGNIFLQGSYATSTAIKTDKIGVDADIGVIFNKEIDRYKLFKKLSDKYSYIVNIKKPCITIFFEEGYSIDVAVYEEVDGEVKNFLNSIPGYETKSNSVPKVLVNDLKKALSSDRNKRDIIRLAKYFIKNTEKDLGVNEENSIPSIGMMLFIMNYSLRGRTLEEKLDCFLTDFKNDCIVKGYNIDYSKYYITNIFRKVTNPSEVNNTLQRVIGLNQQKDYSLLISKKLNEKINGKLSSSNLDEMIGTMG